MALDVYREIPSVLISTALGLRPRAVLISTSGIFPVYRLKPCVNLYVRLVTIDAFLGPTRQFGLCNFRNWAPKVRLALLNFGCRSILFKPFRREKRANSVPVEF